MFISGINSDLIKLLPLMMLVVAITYSIVAKTVIEISSFICNCKN